MYAHHNLKRCTISNLNYVLKTLGFQSHSDVRFILCLCSVDMKLLRNNFMDISVCSQLFLKQHTVQVR